MYRIILFFLLIVLTLQITLYSQFPDGNACILKGVQVNHFSYVPPPSIYKHSDALAKIATSNVEVHFSPDVPDSARNAINYAAEIWSFLLNANQPIRISVDWKELESTNILGGGKPRTFYPIANGPVSSDTILYPFALAKQILDNDIEPDSIDILMSFNSESNWYYGIDGMTPAEHHDLASVALHEIAHGLGYIDSFQYEKQGSQDFGSRGIDASGHKHPPTAYDYFCIKGDNHGTNIYKLVNESEYPNPSYKLGAALVSNDIFFDATNSYWMNNNNNVKLHAPLEWEGGSSISHLDSVMFPVGNSNSLMTSSIGTAEAIHSPGEIGLEVLRDLGWDVNRLVTLVTPISGVVIKPGNSYSIEYTDNYGGNLLIELWEKIDYDIFIPYDNLKSELSSQGINQTQLYFDQTIEDGEYRLAFTDGGDRFGYSNSFIVSDAPQVATPVFSPQPGPFIDPISVEITTETLNTNIYFTLDGTDPDETSDLYTQPLYIDSDVTIKARAYKDGYWPSTVGQAAYSFGSGVYIAQVDEYGNPFGNWKRWYDPGNYWIQRSAGIYSNTQTGSWFHLASQDYKEGTMQKYRQWSTNHGSNIDYFTRNPAYLQIIANATTEVLAQFTTSHSATIQSRLIDGGNPGGVVEFKDPWLPDDYDNQKDVYFNRGISAIFYEKDSPFTVSTNNTDYKGVFLNQGWPDWQPPYYTVSAPTEQEIGGVPSYFLNWTGTDVSYQNPDGLETAVVFQQPNATVTARYKGHRVSNTSQATASPGQRKIIFIEQGTYWGYHMLYESAGDVWYSHSQDGASWSGEVLLSRGNGTARNPAIAEYSNEIPENDYIYVVWVDETERSEASGYDIQVRKRNIQTGEWLPTEAVIDPIDAGKDGYAHPNAKPSAVVYREDPSPTGGHYPRVIIVYEESDGGIISSYHGWQYYYDDFVWRTIPVGDSGSTHGRPSVTLTSSGGWYAVVSYDNNSNLHIVWSEELVQNHSVAQLDFQNPEIIQSSSTYRNYRESVVSSDFSGKIYISWVADWYWGGMYTGEVVLQQTQESGTWGLMHMYRSDISENPYMMPSIAGYTWDTGGILTFSDNVMLYRYASSDGYSWSSLPMEYYNTSGLFYPSVTKLSFSSDHKLILFTEQGGPVYRLEFTESEQLQKVVATRASEAERVPAETFTKEYRSVEFIDTVKGGELSFRFGNIKMTNQQNEVDDLLDFVTYSNTNRGKFLKTQTFQANDYGDISFNINAYSQDWLHDMSILLELKDAQTGDIVSVLENVNIEKNRSVSLNKNIYFDIHTLGVPREVYLSVRLENPDTMAMMVRSIHQTIIEGSESLYKMVESSEEQFAEIPVEFSLLHNYPNPFNPVTTIPFSIPVPSNVTIEVYDIIGRMVARIADDRYDPGNHRIVFDANRLSSGTYIIVMRVSDIGGTERSKIFNRRVLLVK